MRTHEPCVTTQDIHISVLRANSCLRYKSFHKGSNFAAIIQNYLKEKKHYATYSF